MRLLYASILNLCVLYLVSACEKPFVSSETSDDDSETVIDGVRVSFCIDDVEKTFFSNRKNISRAESDVKNVCSKLNFALFQGELKVKTINQDVSDKSFGNVSVVLSKGEYTVVVVAHNGEGYATISSPDEIKFKDNKLTDTFLYCGNIDVKKDGEYKLRLERVVSKIRFVINDHTPADVKRMKFYYTGGSSTLNAKNGTGAVNSRQTEIFDVDKQAYSTSSVYEIYTFPHSDGRKAKLTVTALDESGNNVAERIFENVEVNVNVITHYKGDFFDGSAGDGRAFSFVLDDEWGGEETYEY